MCHILVVYIHCGCSARLEQSATTTSSMVQIISPCSQWLARYHVTIQRCSAAPAPKLSGTEKLLLCHRLMRFRGDCRGDLSSQIGKEMACLHVHWAEGFERDGRKEVFAFNAGVFFLFARSGKFRCSTCLVGRPSDVLLLLLLL